jgi:PAS domain S-box-containing protein
MTMRSPITGAIFRITLPYVILASIWIFASDWLLSLSPLDADTLTEWSMFKGWAFVIVTAVLLATLLRRELLRRARDQEALLESEARLRMIGDNLPDCYVYQYSFDEDGAPRFLYLSSGVERVHGIRAEDALKDSSLLFTLVDPAQLPTLKRAEQASIQTLDDFNVELRMRSSGGQWRWVLLRAHPRHLPGGSIVWDGVATDITERKLAEQTLLESEAMLHALGDNIPSGALFQLLSPPSGHNRYTYLSAGIERIFGLSAASVLADPRPFWALIAEEDRPRIEAARQRSERELSVFECELRQRTTSGQLRWFLARATPRRLSDGATLWDGVVTDITDQKRTVDALRESEARFRSLIESAPDAIFVQCEGRIVFLNQAAVEMFGAPHADALLGTEVMDRIAPEYRKHVLDRIRTQRETGCRAPLMDQEYVRLDGTRISVETTATPIRFQNRDAHLVFPRDVTARKRAEAERERLLAAIDQSGEIVVITDTQGSIQYVNPAFERATGYGRAEVLDQNPRLLKSGKHDAAHYADLWRTIRSGQTWRGRFVNKRKDGTLYNEEASISPVRDADGRTVNFVAVKRDISEQLQLEAQLQQAQKMESVGRLAGGVAHDFNNMLSIILGNAELALGASAPESAIHADLLEIQRTALRSAELTKQLLAFARKQTVVPQVIDLNDAVATTLKMLRRLIEKNVELIWSPVAGDATVSIDPAQLDQILANLVVNARDAIAEIGTITIATGVTTLTPAQCTRLADAVPGHYVTLAVSDTGCGIDAATLEHIFEPFFTTKGVGEGTGLGLATVYGVVRQSRGFISVASEKGKGAAFTVYLPRQSREAEKQPSRPAEEIAGTHRGCILFVEDEGSILQMGKRTLERQGHRVITASEPLEALSWAKRYASEVDLLITDIVMPQMSGWELAKQLLALNPKVKLLFISGYASVTAPSSDLLAKGALFLTKPFSLHLLSAKVYEALSPAPPTRPPAPAAQTPA